MEAVKMGQGDIAEWHSSQWNLLAGKEFGIVTVKQQHRKQRGLTLSPFASLEADWIGNN